MAYSAVPTVNTNDPWSASDHNTYVKDNFAYFKALTDKLVGVCITPQFRLSLTTGDPIGTNTSGGTLYYVPYNGNAIQLYDGASWQVFASAELSLALSVTAEKNYDVFVDYNGGNPTLRLSSAWTNDTTRADALAYQNGRLVKSGTPAYLFVGTIRASASNTTADSVTQRFVWNMYNRLFRRVMVLNSTAHTYNGAMRLWNNSSTNNLVAFVIGEAQDVQMSFSMAGKTASNGTYMLVKMYVDDADGGLNTAEQTQSYLAQYIQFGAPFIRALSAGYHYAQIKEQSNNNADFYTFQMDFAVMM